MKIHHLLHYMTVVYSVDVDTTARLIPEIFIFKSGSIEGRNKRSNPEFYTSLHTFD